MSGYFLTGIFVIALAITFYWLRPARVTCPECDGRKVTKIDQVVEKVQEYDLVSGEGGGKMLMMDIKETFRCRQCEHVWTENRTEA